MIPSGSGGCPAASRAAFAFAIAGLKILFVMLPRSRRVPFVVQNVRSLGPSKRARRLEDRDDPGLTSCEVVRLDRARPPPCLQFYTPLESVSMNKRSKREIKLSDEGLSAGPVLGVLVPLPSWGRDWVAGSAIQQARHSVLRCPDRGTPCGPGRSRTCPYPSVRARP